MSRGRAWEVVLELQHDRYRRDRLAVVFPTPPRVKVLTEPRAGRFTACFAGEGPPDYTGILAGGRGVCFDAKHTSGRRWDLKQLERHQARDLEAFDLAGGLAFVALRIGAAAWVLPWSALGPLWWRWHDGDAARGEASLNPNDCDQIGLRMAAPGDWLHAIPPDMRGTGGP